MMIAQILIKRLPLLLLLQVFSFISYLFNLDSISRVLYIFEASGDSDCLTISGPSKNKPCIFPFKYQGEEQNSCIKSGTKFWCATELKSNGYFKKWGNCGENCPKTCAKYVFGNCLYNSCIWNSKKRFPGLNLLEMPFVMMTITMRTAIMMVEIVVAEKPTTVLNVNVRIQAILTLIQVILSRNKYEGTYLKLHFGK